MDAFLLVSHLLPRCAAAAMTAQRAWLALAGSFGRPAPPLAAVRLTPWKPAFDEDENELRALTSSYITRTQPLQSSPAMAGEGM